MDRHLSVGSTTPAGITVLVGVLLSPHRVVLWITSSPEAVAQVVDIPQICTCSNNSMIGRAQEAECGA